MKKVVFLFFVIISFLCSCTPSKTEQGKVRVGVLLPLTGDIAFMGEMLKNAMLMNQDTSKVVLFFEDSRGDTKTAVSIVNNLISTKHCDVIVSFLPPVSEAINPICEKKSILHFVFAFSPEITQHSNVIKQFPSSDYEAMQFISYAENSKAKKIVYFRHLYPDAELAYKKIVNPILKSKGIDVIDIPHEQSCKDYKNLALKTKNENPDLVVVQSLSMNYKNILTDLYDNQVKNIILDLNCVDFYDENDMIGGLLNDVPFVGMEFILKSSFVNFVKEYRQKYNKKPYVFGAFAYDLMYVLNNLQKTGYEKEMIIDYYHKNEVNGITGRIMYDELGNQIIEYAILCYSNGVVKNYE